MSHGRRVVVGLGNRFRGDDRAGLELVTRLGERLPDGVELVAIEGDPTPLIELLTDAELVLVADAVAGAVRPGAVYRFDASDSPVPGAVFGASTHALGLGETLEIARALGELNARVIVYGIAGEDFGATEALSAPVRAAVELTADQILADLALPGCRAASTDTKDISHA